MPAISISWAIAISIRSRHHFPVNAGSSIATRRSA